ncbi:non-ribosomal peptide synthetase, partial [Massilia rubra]
APLPLSFAQQRLWFLDQLDHAAGAAYHMPAGLRLSGQLDTDALVRALDRIVARHESLRTCFVEVDGTPWQRIGAAGQGMALARHDLSHLRGHEQEQALAAQAQDESAAPFDLARGPLIRARLLRLGEREHVLLVTQHHIVSDGWSVGVLVREFAALYTAFSQSLDDPLAPLAIQYADYALWQRDYLQGEALERQCSFWSAHLAGAPALLELPTDHPRPARQSHAGASVAFALPAALTAQLQALGQRHGATLFMVLLGAWSVLMSRLSGQDDVVIGTPVANRQRAEVEPLIGFFVNTLAVRVRLDADPSVAQLLEQVKGTLLDAYAHQDIPFEQVVEVVKPVRSLAHSPLFQVMLTLNNTPERRSIVLPGLSLNGIESDVTSAQCDLTMSLTEVDGVLAGELTYASSLFEQGTILRLISAWETVLTAMAGDDQQTSSRVPLLSASERHRVLETFNTTRQGEPAERTIHRIVEKQAENHPKAVALRCDGQALSYSELNRKANQLAHYLIGLGIEPDQRVAICMDRSLDMFVGLLAVLKAGAAYVPLDPGYPLARLRYMIEDSAPRVLLTRQDFASVVPQPGLPVLAIDGKEEAAIAAASAANPQVDALTAGHLAYVIYTSGSTGTPKGVMIDHAAACNLAMAQRQLLGLTATAQVLQFASFSFDACVWEILMAWGAGATLHVAQRDALLPGSSLCGTMRDLGITHATLPSAVLALSPDIAMLPRLHLIAAGEVLQTQLAERLRSRHVLMNAYGPTEATVCATAYLVRDDSPNRVPIGKPLANMRVYILDRHGAPVPVGVRGEMYIGGAGIGRGYLGRADLTAERFVADPFSDKPGARMYKTGDIGRWLDDGNVDYVGRNDTQVKLRGFRIEPGEIESRLRECAGVREAVVVVRAQAAAADTLVAYLTCDTEDGGNSAHWRRHLSELLPDYMVPAHFVVLAAMPLTPNGKIDVGNLPAPQRAALALAAVEEPDGPVETVLAALWCELLGLARVGRNDNFFELGGHSLQVVRLIGRIREQFDVELSPKAVFQSPVLVDLSETIIEAKLAAFSDEELAAMDAELNVLSERELLNLISESKDD